MASRTKRPPYIAKHPSTSPDSLLGVDGILHIGTPIRRRGGGPASIKEGRTIRHSIKATSVPPALNGRTSPSAESFADSVTGSPARSVAGIRGTSVRPASIISTSSTVLSAASSNSGYDGTCLYGHSRAGSIRGRTAVPGRLGQSEAFVKPFDRTYRRRPPPQPVLDATIAGTGAAAVGLAGSAYSSSDGKSLSPLSRKASTIRRTASSARSSQAKVVSSARQRPRGFVFRHGRRYVSETFYVLPHDLRELQRQNLNTILTTTVLGSPLRAPIDPLNPPTKILEMGCADGYWSSLCHDFFGCLGLTPPAFVGLDIAPQGPDLSRYGMDWTYVMHDLNIRPLPFEDESFDIIMSKDMTVAISFEAWWLMLPELLRILKPGGFLEFRDRDYQFRTLRAPSKVSNETSLEDARNAHETACYDVQPGTSFVDCENEFLRDVSEWTRQVMEARGQHSTPMRALEGIESWFGWEEFEIRRIAIPLSPLTDWERGIDRPSLATADSSESRPELALKIEPFSELESVPDEDLILEADAKPASAASLDFAAAPLQLNADQQAVRATALQVVIGLIESMEPYLRKVCGKNEEEWRRWWNFMIMDLVEGQGAARGECLEIGVAWGRKEIKKQQMSEESLPQPEQPAQTPLPAQTSPTSEASLPAQTSLPSQTSLPAQVSLPAQTSLPAQISLPAQTSLPARMSLPSLPSQPTTHQTLPLCS